VDALFVLAEKKNEHRIYEAMKMSKNYKRVAAYIDLDAVEANVASMKAAISSDCKIAAVIKTDGYGHGALPIAKVLEDKDYLWGFAVATIDEALELRENGIQKPILVLGYTFPEFYPEIIEWNICPTIFTMEAAEELSKAAKRENKIISVHIKVDTGMGRIGFPDTQESVQMISKIQKLPNLRMEGLFTHFARADEYDKTSVLNQISRFHHFAESCRKSGVNFDIYHVSNSAGIFELEQANLSMVRAGIAIYGLLPSDEVEKERIPLRPVMELKSHLVHVKEVENGTPISYGGTYVAKEKRMIATVPVGYGDGYPRSLSNKGYVLIAGKRAPICGRICMDQFMVDVTGISEAKVGMEVTLLGADGDAHISMEELSNLSGRFNYEFVCDISKRVPRIYLKNKNMYMREDFGNTSDKA